VAEVEMAGNVLAGRDVELIHLIGIDEPNGPWWDSWGSSDSGGVWLI
jgi:hypothetical protein